MSDSVHIACPGCGSLNRVPSSRLADDPKCGRCGAPLFHGAPIDLDEQQFVQQLKGDLPVVVDFWAEWCGPCKMMAPAFKAAAAQLEPKVRLAKVNTEQQQNLAMRYGIRSIPTLVMFRGGQEVARVSGAMDATGLVSWVRQNL